MMTLILTHQGYIKLADGNGPELPALLRHHSHSPLTPTIHSFGTVGRKCRNILVIINWRAEAVWCEYSDH